MLRVLSTLRLLNLRPIDLPQREVVEFVRHFRLSNNYLYKTSCQGSNAMSLLVSEVRNPTHNQAW